MISRRESRSELKVLVLVAVVVVVAAVLISTYSIWARFHAISENKF